MDVLTEVMRLLRTQGQLYGRLEFTAPWAFDFPGDKAICLMVAEGSCLLGVDGGVEAALQGGDFVFLPNPHRYSLRSSTEMTCRAMESVVPEETFRRTRLITAGGGGAPTSLIAGCFTFATPESEWLVGYLPRIMRVSTSGAHARPWFQSTCHVIAAELAQDLPGSTVIVDRLAEVLFVQAMRIWITAPAAQRDPSWLRGLADPQIAAALRLMYVETERAWTVPELARQVSMSRSAFAARFRELVGDTPLEHLTRWRMVRAAGLIREDHRMTLSAIAATVGYESESAFGKAFRRITGVSPGHYRQNPAHDNGWIYKDPNGNF